LAFKGAEVSTAKDTLTRSIRCSQQVFKANSNIFTTVAHKKNVPKTDGSDMQAMFRQVESKAKQKRFWKALFAQRNFL